MQYGFKGIKINSVFGHVNIIYKFIGRIPPQNGKQQDRRNWNCGSREEVGEGEMREAGFNWQKLNNHKTEAMERLP